ncbi:hypothetical protein [Yinghuangia sp. YIM S09857]|uniref:hypothetical protein n=1 Tax=Yinghuangia sp. YIM S09857 TaxID=3436929 RepID=UPI003F53954B
MHKTMKQISKAATAFVLSVGVTATLAPTADAAGDSVYLASYYDDSFSLASHVRFHSYDETFTVYDDKADGHGAGVQIDLKDSRGVWVLWSTSYLGTGDNTSRVFDYDIAEGRKLRFRSCVMDGAADPRPTCGPSKEATA